MVSGHKCAGPCVCVCVCVCVGACGVWVVCVICAIRLFFFFFFFSFLCVCVWGGGVCGGVCVVCFWPKFFFVLVEQKPGLFIKLFQYHGPFVVLEI